MSEGHNPFLAGEDPSQMAFGGPPQAPAQQADLSFQQSGLTGYGVQGTIDTGVKGGSAGSISGSAGEGELFASGGPSSDAGGSFPAADTGTVPLLGGLTVGGATTSATVAGAAVAAAVAGDSQKKKSTGWIFSLSYYQQFFDVDTDHVNSRIRHACVTPTRGDFLALCGDNPDLYGPFWTCATLVFLCAMGGNYAVYLSSSRFGDAFDFDISKVSMSTALIYGYANLWPVGLYFTLQCFGGVNVHLIKLLCVYGYALAIFVPVSALCIIPVDWLRWVFVIVAIIQSSAFLLANIRPIVKESPKGVTFTGPLIMFLWGSHIVFGLILKLYFFQYF